MTDTDTPKVEFSEERKAKDAAINATLNKLDERAVKLFEGLLEMPKDEWPDPAELAEQEIDEFTEEECRQIAQSVYLKMLLIKAEREMMPQVTMYVFK